MKEESRHCVNTVEVEDYYVKIDDKVYHKWRFAGKKKWYKELMPYKEIPLVYLNKIVIKKTKLLTREDVI